MKYQKQYFHKIIKFGTLTQLPCFAFLLNFIEMLWNFKQCQKIGVGRRLGQVRAKNVLAQTIPENIF